MSSRIMRNPGLPIPLTGATTATRFVGGNNGIPTTGTWAVGDMCTDPTSARIYVCTTAGAAGTAGWVDVGQDPVQAGLAIKAWGFTPGAISASSAATSQTILTLLVPTVAGQSYLGVKLWVITAGTSTVPTSFFVGLASNGVIGASGTMLAQSSNLKSSGSLTSQGIQTFAFNATYTETATGLRQIVVLMDGTFAGTNVLFAKGTIAAPGSGQGLAYAAGTGQTALPSNTSSLPGAYTNTGAILLWSALY